MLIKNKLREEYLKKRIILSEKETKKKSLKILDNIINSDLIKQDDFLLLYKSIKNEPLIFELIKLENKCFLPVIIEKNNFIPYEVDIETLYIKNKYNIDEPKKKNKNIFDYLKFNNRLVVLCPGIVFDENYNRIGFGKGYYDNFFLENSDKINFLKIGICYDYQLLKTIPANSFDVKMDYIITDKRIIIRKKLK